MDTWDGPHDTHPCPGPRCGGRAAVPWHMLMCRADWYATPKPLRTALWRTWRDGAGAGSPAHREAMRAAVAAAGRV